MDETCVGRGAVLIGFRVINPDSFPVTASIAAARLSDVLVYITPPIMSGVDSFTIVHRSGLDSTSALSGSPNAMQSEDP